MLSVILSLLGVGGVAGAALYFIGPMGLIAMIRKVPAWAWVAIAFGILLLLVWHWHSIAEKRMQQEAYNAGFNRAYTLQQARIEQWRRANAIDAKSIGDLQVSLEQKNQESRDRAAALEKVRTDYAKDRAALDRLAQEDAKRVGLLQGIQDHAQAVPTCKAPRALREALGGL